MKKKLFLTLTIVFLIIGLSDNSIYAQQMSPCSEGLSKAFGPVSTQKPVLLKRLGTSPQFGEIPQHTSQSAFAHLKKVHTRNLRGSRVEMDNFFKVLGYSGFNDPALTADKLVPVILQKGKIGWMGAYSRGHKYRWSILGNDFESFKIKSKDGSCSAYIMRKCGNAFYDPSEKEDCIPCTECDPNFKDKSVCPDCSTQELTYSGTGHLVAGDVVNTTKSFPIVGNYNGKKLCIGEQTVPVRLTYEFTADGRVDYSRAFQVCDFGQNAPTSFNMPIQMSYQVSESNINLANQLEVPLTKKQYKKLKRAYNDCTVENMSAPVVPVITGQRKNFSAGSPVASLSNNVSTNPLNCVKQEITLTGNAQMSDANVNSENIPVTIIGRYVKSGKLKKGETADKYRCMGTFNMPANSLVQYNLTGDAKAQHYLELCDTGNVNPNETLSVPMTLTSNFTQQNLMIGDYGKIYVPLTKQEYKRVSKLFQRCCGDGTTKCF